MHQQLPHVSYLQAGYPDLGKLIFDQQLHQMLRIPPVRLLLAHHRRPYPRGIPKPQLYAQLPPPPLKPPILPACLHAHSNFLAAQAAVKLLRFLTVLQSFLLHLSRSIVKDRHLLKSWMKITTYNQHDVGSSQ